MAWTRGQQSSMVCSSGTTTDTVEACGQYFAGVSVTSDLLIVGMHQSVTCSSDSGVVERIEWQREGQVVIEATSVQQLELVLDPVSDTDHGVVVTCVVTRSEVDRPYQSITISVTG